MMDNGHECVVVLVEDLLSDIQKETQLCSVVSLHTLCLSFLAMIVCDELFQH